MKKSMFRSVSAFLVLVIILSVLPVAAYAATTFFQRNWGGFSCTGSGTLSVNIATAHFHATALPNEPIIPDENCVSEIWIIALDSSGQSLGAVVKPGTTHADAELKTSATIYKAFTTFEFMNADLGTYSLENH